MRFIDLQLHSTDKHVKTGLKSVLDDIDGIGTKRKTSLLRTFGSIKKMKEASFDELRQAGLPEKVAKTFKTRYKTNNY